MKRIRKLIHKILQVYAWFSFLSIFNKQKINHEIFMKNDKKCNIKKIIYKTVVPHSFYLVISIIALFCNFFSKKFCSLLIQLFYIDIHTPFLPLFLYTRGNYNFNLSINIYIMATLTLLTALPSSTYFSVLKSL